MVVEPKVSNQFTAVKIPAELDKLSADQLSAVIEQLKVAIRERDLSIDNILDAAHLSDDLKPIKTEFKIIGRALTKINDEIIDRLDATRKQPQPDLKTIEEQCARQVTRNNAAIKRIEEEIALCEKEEDRIIPENWIKKGATILGFTASVGGFIKVFLPDEKTLFAILTASTAVLATAAVFPKQTKKVTSYTRKKAIATVVSVDMNRQLAKIEHINFPSRTMEPKRLVIKPIKLAI